MTTTKSGKYELTATKDDDGIRSVITERYRTRQAAEDAAHRAREFGWATRVERV